jgi:SAM-dependent methyltransferase
MLSDRVAREKAHFNTGLQRAGYTGVLSHTDHFYRQLRRRINAERLQYGHGKTVLEIGSTGWAGLAEYGILPKELHCINISETELKKGEDLSVQNQNQPCFHVMDAHNLQFEDGYFDLVFGSSVLHHLDFVRALDEIRRVLKVGGKIHFFEPLGINPASKLVRRLTPQARTADERPLGFAELKKLRQRFRCEVHYEQMFSVPFGVLSRALYRNPDNPMMKAIFHLDRSLDRLVPPLRPFFRNVIIVGTRSDR